MFQNGFRWTRYSVAGAIIVCSTLLFAIWWLFGRGGEELVEKSSKDQEKVEENQTNELQTLEVQPMMEFPKFDPLTTLYCGNRILDVETGETLIEGLFAKEPIIKRLYFWRARKHFIVFHSQSSFSQYDSRGQILPKLTNQDQLPAVFRFSDDLKRVLFSAKGDIWSATANWEDGVLDNFETVTNVGVIPDRHFSKGIHMQTDKMLLTEVRNQKLLVNLETKETQEINFPSGRAVQVSPGADAIMGVTKQQMMSLGYYDLRTNQSKVLEPLARGAITQVLWVGNEKCLVLRGNRQIELFDREKGTYETFDKNEKGVFIAGLGSPSPDLKWVVFGLKQGVRAVFDVNDPDRSAVMLPAPATQGEWLNGDEIIFQNSSMNSEQRGTWVFKISEEKMRRIHPQPLRKNPREKWPIFALNESLSVIYANGDFWRYEAGDEQLTRVTESGNWPSTFFRIVEFL